MPPRLVTKRQKKSHSTSLSHPPPRQTCSCEGRDTSFGWPYWPAWCWSSAANTGGSRHNSRELGLNASCPKTCERSFHRQRLLVPFHQATPPAPFWVPMGKPSVGLSKRPRRAIRSSVTVARPTVYWSSIMTIDLQGFKFWTAGIRLTMFGTFRIHPGFFLSGITKPGKQPRYWKWIL